MKDRIPLYPGRVKLVPVSGQSNIYDMSRADQPTQEGTPLNKITFLTDAVAALFNLSSSAVPNDVFQILARAALLNSNGTALVTPSGSTILNLPATRIKTGSYTGTGTYGKDNPNTLTFGFEPKFVIISGNYDVSVNGTRIAFLPYSSPRGIRFYNLRDNDDISAAVRGIGISWNSNSVNWYNYDSADSQLNASGATYTYIAFGF